MTQLPYVACRNSDGTWYALLPDNITEVGPYPTLEELERDMERINEHLAAGSFGGAK